MSGESDVTVVTTLVCFSSLRTRMRVRRAPGIPCALGFEGGTYWQTSGEITPRECGTVSASLRGATATKQSTLTLAARRIASRSLSSGARSRDPLARNDGLLWLFEIRISLSSPGLTG